MDYKPYPKLLVVGVALVLALSAICLDTSLASAVPAELEAEVSRFLKNVSSWHLHGYLDMVEQFTNPYYYESDEGEILYFEARLDELIESTIIPMLLDRESSQFYQETITYFREKADAWQQLYAAKNGSLDDPDLAAAIRTYAEEAYLVQMFIWYQFGIAFLDGAIELEPVGPEEFEAELLEWLSQSAYLGNSLKMHSKTAVIFMVPDMTYGEVAFQEHEGQWTAEIPFFDEYDGSTGSYMLTFTQQEERWKIAKVRTHYLE